MTKRARTCSLFVLLAGIFLTIPVSASDLPQDAALFRAEGRHAEVFVEYTDWERSTETGNTITTLTMGRFVLNGRLPIVPGWMAIGEVGYHQPDYGFAKNASGGITWGLGTEARLYKWVLRDSPVLGPREWFSFTTGAFYQGGVSDSDEGQLSWSLLKGELGIEYAQFFSVPPTTQKEASGIRIGGGVILNALDADIGPLSGSEESSAGGYIRIRYDLENNAYVG